MEVLDCCTICFPRIATPPEGEEVHIVSFADGSITAVCAAVYAVWPLPGAQPGRFNSTINYGQVPPVPDVWYIHSQGRALLPPTCSQALLHGAVTGQLQASLPLHHRRLQCAIAITKKTVALLKPYSANRTGEIDDLAREARKHPLAAIPGEDNPADLRTRGRIAIKDMSSEFWRKGPRWLQGGRGLWPLPTGLAQEVPREELPASGASCLAATAPAPVQAVGSQRRSGGLDHRHRGHPLLVLGCCTPLPVQKVQVDIHQGAWDKQRTGQQPGMQPPTRLEGDSSRDKKVEGGVTEDMDVLGLGSQWERLLVAVERNLAYSSILNKCKRITARVTRLFMAGPSTGQADLKAEDMQAAEALHFLAAAPAPSQRYMQASCRAWGQWRTNARCS